MPKKLKSDLLLIFFVIIWGSTFALGKIALEYIDMLPLITIRFVLGFAAVLLFMKFTKKSNNKDLELKNKKLILKSALAGIILFLSIFLQLIGLEKTSAVNAAFITSSGVLLIPIFSAIFHKEYPTPATVFALAISLVGIVFVSGIADISLKDGFIYLNWHFSKINSGNIIILISTALFSLQAVYAGGISDKYKAVNVTFYQLMFFVIMSFTVYAISGFKGKVKISNLKILIILLILGVFASGLCYLALNYIYKTSSASHIAIILIMEPIFGALFARIIPDIYGNVEYFSINQILGSIIILASVGFSEYINISKKRKNIN